MLVMLVMVIIMIMKILVIMVEVIEVEEVIVEEVIVEDMEEELVVVSESTDIIFFNYCYKFFLISFNLHPIIYFLFIK